MSGPGLRFLEAGKGAAWEAAAGTRVCCCCSCSSSGTMAAGFLGAEKGHHARKGLVLGCVAVVLGAACRTGFGARVDCCWCLRQGPGLQGSQWLERGQQGRQQLALGCVAVAVAVQVVPGQQNSKELKSGSMGGRF